MHQAYLRDEKKYNLRCRKVKFIPGQEIYRRNFRQSEFWSGYNAKLAGKFLKCLLVRPVGNSLYDVKDLQGKVLGIFDANDLKQ